MRAAGEKFSAFFCNFVYFKSIGEKICILFTNWGKICISPLFYPLSIIFSPTCYLVIFLPPPRRGGANRKIYTPFLYFQDHSPEDKVAFILPDFTRLDACQLLRNAHGNYWGFMAKIEGGRMKDPPHRDITLLPRDFPTSTAPCSPQIL